MITARKRHILEEHYLDFYSRAVSILDDHDDAKDAVQEAVVRTLVQVGVNDMVAYCFRATENECINILRRRRRLMKIDKTMIDETMIDSDENSRILQLDVKNARAALLPMERRVIELRHDHGYTIAETAKQVRLSGTTVKRLMNGAEEKIKHIVKRK